MQLLTFAISRNPESTVQALEPLGEKGHLVLFPGASSKVPHAALDTSKAFAQLCRHLLPFGFMAEPFLRLEGVQRLMETLPGAQDLALAFQLELFCEKEHVPCFVALPAPRQAIVFFQSVVSLHRQFPKGPFHKVLEQILRRWREPSTSLVWVGQATDLQQATLEKVFRAIPLHLGDALP